MKLRGHIKIHGDWHSLTWEWDKNKIDVRERWVKCIKI